jgi:hypothetical protein
MRCSSRRWRIQSSFFCHAAINRRCEFAGSSGSTSSPAASTVPSFIASYSASTSTTGPRAVLIRIMPRLAAANVSAPIRPRVSAVKSLDTFDFNAQPSLNKALVLELAHRERIEKRQNRIAPPAPHRDWLRPA